MNKVCSITFAWLVLLLSFSAQGVDYLRDVKPVLKARCYACHGALKQKSGLRLDTAVHIRKGAKSNPVVSPGKINESKLLARITSKNLEERMPPEGEPLKSAEIAAIKQWIAAGAPEPTHEKAQANPHDHWSFQPIQRQPLPSLKPHPASYNSIDLFLESKRRQHNLKSNPPANASTQLRRVYLDLIGLPPTRDQVKHFQKKSITNPQVAFEEVVDELLASPRYGERWGRHWMDIWRYSDWAGWNQQMRYSQKHIWHWRDWIIESINGDKGYDQMILEMLAADEFSTDPDTIRATGFLARNWYKFDRNVWLDDAIEHTGRAFLGMTFKCARCHDHKYDPVSQREYYQLRAIFEPYDVRTDRLPGELDVSKGGLARVYDAKPAALTYLFERGDPKNPDKENAMAPGVPAVIGGAFKTDPVTLPLASWYPALRGFVADELFAKAKANLAAAETDLAKVKKQLNMAKNEARKKAAQTAAVAEKKVATAKARLKAVEARIAAEQAKHKIGKTKADPKLLAKAAAKAERVAALTAADEELLNAKHELDQSKDKKKMDAAQKKITAAQAAFDKAKKAVGEESSKFKPLGPQYSKTSTGRRLAFARWITSRQNPLTARVAVNHIWLRHFGQPLVEKMDDFGLRSRRPPLADLLDFLAAELMANGWRMKPIHKLIVTSVAYRMDSRPVRNSESVLRAQNSYLCKMNAVRMEAETVRDALLHVAGSLDLTRGGPDLDFRKGLTVPRRSVYFRHAREKQMEFLRMFDTANPSECYRRQASIRPQQAYALVNSSLALAQSRKLAGRLSRRAVDDEAFVLAAYETVLSRGPSKNELRECRRFLSAQSSQLANPQKLELLGTTPNAVPPAKDPTQRARENLVLVLFNHNDFVTIR